MSPEHEIDYEALIDRSINNFEPVKRLWPANLRLACWILLEAAILGLAVWLRGYANLPALLHHAGQLAAGGLFLSASIAAAFMALKSAIPGREPSWPQLAITIAMVAGAFGFAGAGAPFANLFTGAPTAMLPLFALGALPWLSLFWAVRRGVPTQPEVSGGTVGLAAFCFALALDQIVNQPGWIANAGLLPAVSCTVVVIIVSALAGRWWLNWIARWQQQPVATEVSTSIWTAFNATSIFPLAFAASIAALLLILISPGPHMARVPDFDLAIESYQHALADFRPNVPSASMETMLTAYVEHGMPAYMWDFGPEGFTLVGGRWAPLPDGTPATYTWFRGRKGGIMCMFRQTEAFNPPPLAHEDRHHFLFYRYRDFSLCLINVGGYGNFISVIAAPMPLKQFEHLVLATAL